MQDGEVRKAFQRSLSKQGFKFKLGTKVNGATIENNKVKLDLEPAKGGDKEVFEADVVLVSAGILAQLIASRVHIPQNGRCSLLALHPVSHGVEETFKLSVLKKVLVLCLAPACVNCSCITVL